MYKVMKSFICRGLEVAQIL